MSQNSDSDSSDCDLDDPFTKSLFQQSTSKNVNEIAMVTADEILARRVAWRDAYQKLENFTPTNGEDVKEDAAAVDIPDESSVDRISIQTIQDVHPGRNILCTVDSLPNCDTVALVYDNCIRYWDPASTFSQHFARWGAANFRIIINNRMFSVLNSGNDADMKVVTANLMYLMAISREEMLSDSCLDLLQQMRGRCRPNLGDILHIFRFWGIPTAALIPSIYGDDNGFNLYEQMPQFCPRDHNIAQMMQYLSTLFDQEPTVLGLARVSLLFRSVLLVQLDVSLRMWTQTHLCQTFLSSLLYQISEEEWDDDSALREFCDVLQFQDEHFHNQAYICALLRDGCSRCQRIGTYLSWSLVQQMSAGGDVTPRQEEVSLLSLIQLLTERKATIFSLDLYRSFVLLKVVRSLVTALNISCSDLDELQHLIDFITELKRYVPNNVSMDCTKIKSLISMLSIQYMELKKNLEPTLNDSQMSQPTPIKQF